MVVVDSPKCSFLGIGDWQNLSVSAQVSISQCWPLLTKHVTLLNAKVSGMYSDMSPVKPETTMTVTGDAQRQCPAKIQCLDISPSVPWKLCSPGDQTPSFWMQYVQSCPPQFPRPQNFHFYFTYLFTFPQNCSRKHLYFL